MPEPNFDPNIERELASLESGPVGDLFRSATRSITPQPAFANNLEAHLRALANRKLESPGIDFCKFLSMNICP